MAYQRFTLGPKLAAHDWPLQLARGAMSQTLATNKDFALTASALHDYFFRNPEARIQQAITHAELAEKRGKDSQSSDASDALDAMIAATYREGVELYRTFGNTFYTIKTARQSAAATTEWKISSQRFDINQLTDELQNHRRVQLERDGSNAKRRDLPKDYRIDDEHLAGCLHVAEMLYAVRVQASAALLHEEGVMPTEDYEKVIDGSYAYLATQGHLGPYAFAMAQPAIETLLRNDTRKIMVHYAQGREAYPDVPSTSHFTRAAYFNAEEHYLSSASWINRQEYLQHTVYPQAMGEWYLKAFQEKSAAALKATHAHILLDHKITLESLSTLPRFNSIESLEYDHFKRNAHAYVGKHGIALMQPEIANVLDKQGKFTPMNSLAIDYAFHHGYHPPYLDHIRNICTRLNSNAHHSRPADEHLTLPKKSEPSARASIQERKPWSARALEDRTGRKK